MALVSCGSPGIELPGPETFAGGFEPMARQQERSMGACVSPPRVRRCLLARSWRRGSVESSSGEGITTDLPPVDRILHYRPPTATRIFADDGTQIGEFYFERRYLVPLEECSPIRPCGLHRRRRRELLPSQRHRFPEHRPRALPQPAARYGSPRGKHDHPAGRQVAAPEPREELPTKAARDRSGASPGAATDEGRDPLPVLESDLFRKRRVRGRSSSTGVLRQGSR